MALCSCRSEYFQLQDLKSRRKQNGFRRIAGIAQVIRGLRWPLHTARKYLCPTSSTHVDLGGSSSGFLDALNQNNYHHP